MGDFGGSLRLARERRGISVRQIAASTKISVAALEALERNDVSKLPGGIFSRAFVRSYALEVGLDPDATVHEFLERFQPDAAPVRAAPVAIAEDESSFESQQRVARVVFLLVLISLPLIGVVLYFTLRAPRSAPQPASATAESAATSGSDAATAGPAAGSPPRNPDVGAAVPATTAANTMAITLELQPTGDCWVKLTVDGQQAFSRVMHAGEKEVRLVRDSAVIAVGNAGAFAYLINGRPGKALGVDGQVRTARITRATLSQYVQ
jgi:cytoskeletal protein RodZ